MTLTFWGAAQTVTGSLHFLELDAAGPGGRPKQYDILFNMSKKETFHPKAG